MAKKTRLMDKVAHKDDGHEPVTDGTKQDVVGDKDAETQKEMPSAPSVSMFQDNDKKPKTVRSMTYLLDPEDCRRWQYHDRFDESLTVEKCQDLIESIQKEGQKQPIVVRESTHEEGVYEVVYGARRHFSCLYIKQHHDPSFRVRAYKIDSGNDVDAAALTYLENEEREGISEFERAVFFRRILGLEGGYDPLYTDDEISTARQKLMERYSLDKGKLSKLLKCAELQDYPDIMAVIIDRTQIPFTHGHKLATLLSDVKQKEAILSAAKELSKGKVVGVSRAIKVLIEAVEPKPSKEKPMIWEDKNGASVMKFLRSSDGSADIKLTKNAKGMTKEELLDKFNDLLDSYLE